MNSAFFEALDAIQEERGIPKAYMLDKIKAAIASAVKREKGVPADSVDVVVDEKKQEFTVSIKKTVVDEVTNPQTEISLPDALDIDVSYRVGDTVPMAFDPQTVGRIAAKIGKNVIIQAINEAVNGSLIQEFEKMKGSVVSGKVTRRDEHAHCIYVELLGYEMQVSDKDLIPGESFKDGDMIKICVSDVRKNSKSQEILLSRTSPDFLKALFVVEVPEITDGIINIVSVSREAGSRSKVAVRSNDPDVDALGACIGPHQARINAILENLSGEKIDLIPYSDDPAQFIISALSPAVVKMFEISPETHSCKVLVPADQLSLAIGRTGQNVRLAARLTGYRIDIVAE